MLDAVLCVFANPTFSAGTHCGGAPDDVALVVIISVFLLSWFSSACILAFSVLFLVGASSVSGGKAGI